jgi:hypothetical protein
MSQKRVDHIFSRACGCRMSRCRCWIGAFFFPLLAQDWKGDNSHCVDEWTQFSATRETTTMRERLWTVEIEKHKSTMEKIKGKC